MLLNKFKLTQKAKKTNSLSITTGILHKNLSNHCVFWRKDESDHQLLHMYKIERILTLGLTRT